MRRLLLLRHAKADRPPQTDDGDRPLTERGTAAARLMGGYMARHGLVPDRVLCSPSLRTRETLAGMAAQWPDAAKTIYDERLYMAGPQTILAVIAEEGGGAKTLMVIGHNPGLHEAADLLIAAGDVVLRERLREKFPTCALAAIDFTVKTWNAIHDHSGRLERFVTPRTIAAATS
jgi:phosphohistidine phosphatase